MIGVLDKQNTFSKPFKVVSSDAQHSRLFVWGRWGAEETNSEVEEVPYVQVKIAFQEIGPWFIYNEGTEEIEEKGEIIGEEEVPLLVDSDCWKVLKDIQGLWVRLELAYATENTKIEYRLI